MGGLILLLSITVQLAAAFVAFRLLRVTEWRVAWSAVAAGLLLMAGRRMITLYHVATGTGDVALDLGAELVALVISLTMLIGVALLGPHLRSARDTEKALRRTERRLRALVDHLPDAVWLLRDGRISGANQAFRRILGFSEEELEGRSPAEFLHPDDRERARSEIEQIFAGEPSVPNEYRMRHKDGGYVPVEAWSKVVELDGGSTLLTVFRDIRERKGREEALRRSERRFVAFMEHLPAVAFIKDREGRHVYANGSFERLFGLEPEEWRGKRNDELFPREVASRFTEHDRAVIEGEEARTVEEEVPTSVGERVLRTQRFPVFGEDGSLSLLGAIGRDVTDQRRIGRLQRRLTTVIEQATELVLITDPAGTIEYVNPAFEEITGYAAEEAVGRTPRMLKSGEQDEAFHRRMWRTLQGGEAWSGRFVNRRSDGEIYQQETTISPVTGPGGEIVGYVAIGHDVTHRLRLEERLRHAERMEAIGTLTGGVAHDFNNILAVVLSSVELALETVPEEHDEARDALADLKRTAEVGADTVRKLLVFSRREPLSREPLDLGAELEEIVSTLRRLLPASVGVELDAEGELPPVRADRAAIQQVLMNLATNARDAMGEEEGGVFRIEASATVLTREDSLQLGEIEVGEYLVVSVSDTGKGMDEETAERAFEPFFTTKESGHGTGLGLATVYSLVRQHDGWIQLHSELGMGTNFRLFLPTTSDQVPGEDEPRAPAEVSGAGRTVLLVEDDGALRRVAERMLQRLDFEVLAAPDGDEGWRLFRQDEDRVDVVVSDLVMPGMGGGELLSRIHERSPDMPLILSSGYATGEAKEAVKSLAEHVTYLQKPWTVRDLAAVIAEALA